MSKIKISDSDGNVLTGRLPDSWADVPLAKYAVLAAATDWPARCRALAALCELPEAPLLADVRLCVKILRSAPFLLDGPLPGAPDKAPDSFRHLGIVYVPAPAHLEQVSGGQLEALLGFLQAHDGNPLAAAPHLLAALYKPEGSELSREVVEASTVAFASLPMALGYGLLLDFYQRSVSWSLPIQRYLAVQPVVEQTLNALETLSRTLDSPGRSWNMGRWLLKVYLKLVTRTLKAS